MSGSKKARLVRQLHNYTILNSYCPATCHLQCTASQSKWIVLASAITSKFQEEAGWRERRKDRFTSFKKITWYSHTSLLVDSHWLEHRRMPTPAEKEIGSVVFNSRRGCVPLLWRKESKDNGLDNEQSSPQTPNDVLAKKFQTENSDLECQYDVNIFLR